MIHSGVWNDTHIFLCLNKVEIKQYLFLQPILSIFQGYIWRSFKDRKASLSARRRDSHSRKPVENYLKWQIQVLLLSRTYSQFTLFFTDILVLRRDFSVTVQYPCQSQITSKHQCKSGCCVMVGTLTIASLRWCYGHLVVIYFDLKWKSCSRKRQMSLVVKQ
jgi:hypothetical protein